MVPLVLSATAAAAAAVPVDAPPPPADFDAPPKLRNGIVLGLALGGGVFGASGYPNASSQIGDPRFYSASGLMGGTSSSILLMGAISDYVNFGFWLGGNSSTNDHWQAAAGGGGIRVEIFPFVRLYPNLNGLAFFGSFGVGSGSLKSKEPDPVAEASGVQSYAGAGTFVEFPFGHVLGGHFAIGPSLEYDAVWSQPFERHGAVFNVRFVLYGGP
jgi:hypothetical protein